VAISFRSGLPSAVFLASRESWRVAVSFPPRISRCSTRFFYGVGEKAPFDRGNVIPGYINSPGVCRD
jgi:hypothetical protein